MLGLVRYAGTIPARAALFALASGSAAAANGVSPDVGHRNSLSKISSKWVSFIAASRYCLTTNASYHRALTAAFRNSDVKGALFPYSAGNLICNDRQLQLPCGRTRYFVFRNEHDPTGNFEAGEPFS